MKKTPKKILSIVLSAVLLVVCIPLSASSAQVNVNDMVLHADASTMDAWKELFPIGTNISTENAGGVWMDKSVFLTNDSFFNLESRISENGVEVVKKINLNKKQDSFLVALSAMASNMTIMGQASVPTETMLVLDLSGSMNRSNNNVAEDLVEAANSTIQTLLDTNKKNRVGVIVYSDSTVTMLPLGRYETGSDGEYLNYNYSSMLFFSSESISVDSNVVYEGTNTRPYTGSAPSASVSGATFIQKGVNEAIDQFIENVDGAAIGGKPILVLMSDGAPTRGSVDFTNPTEYDFGNGTDPTAALAFVTQLTLANAKNKIEQAYGTECLIYTLGVGLSNDRIAESVLDPKNSTTAINDFWTSYNNARVGGTITVSGRNAVTKISDKLDQQYVDKYFAADGNDLAEELKKSFGDIAGEIQLQSKYFPTLISGREDLSGYITFIDNVGDYMQVVDVKGIMIHDTLFSGAYLASNFVDDGGRLGDGQNYTELGREMLVAIKQRLGITDDETAKAILSLAYRHGQLSYTSANEFSNYIGWYANANGEFLGFYHEGVTVLPEATGDPAKDPAYTVKSYCYLGEVDSTQGVAESDMMYATVQVRKSIKTGEETVTFAIPASLIPVVSYEVTLDENNQLTDLTTSGATAPIRLVYEVALDESINSNNITEKVSAEYIDKNSGPNGEVYFYASKWDSNNMSYGTINTNAYFNPSRQNNKYYFLQDSPVYADQNGTLYNTIFKPTGVKYSAKSVYVKNGNNLSTETHYHEINDQVLYKAVKNEQNNLWYIPAGLVHVHMDAEHKGAANNPTETLEYSSIGFVDITNHGVDDYGYEYYVGSTLGNNGRVTVSVETGIKITKTLAEGATPTNESFTFTLTNTTNANDNTTYDATLLSGNTSTPAAVSFNNGKATVSLSAGTSIYIIGMNEGDVISVVENETAEYSVDSISVNGAAANEAVVTLQENKLEKIEFVNADRKTGTLTIGKEVEHQLGNDYQMPEKSFTITVELEGIGTENNTFAATKTADASLTSVTTTNGKFTVTLKHDESISVMGIPEGTVATVVETNYGAGFTPSYWENGVLGDGRVTVSSTAAASVVVINGYAPSSIEDVNLAIGGTKYVKNEDGTAVTDWGGNTFDVVLEKYTPNGWTEVQTIRLNNANKTFSFDLSSENYSSAGVYSYQVREIEPAANDVNHINGMLYDMTKHTFSVYVSDMDMDGALEIVRVHSDHANKDFTKVGGVWTVTTDFTNVQYVTAPATASINVQKILSNASQSPIVSLAGYSFGVYTNPECTNPVTDAVVGVKTVESDPTDSIGEAQINVLFDETGSHTFYIKEIAGTNQKMIYDPKVVKVDVTVSNAQGGALVATVDYDVNTNSEGEIEFTNSYAPTAAELTIDFVKKQLNGRDFANTDNFTFKIEQTNLAANETAQVLTGNILEDTDNDRITGVSFGGKLTFNKVGTYTFVLSETSTDGNGITTDKTVYTVRVTVTDQNGQLIADYVVVNDTDDEVIFVNTYKPTPVSFNLEATKQLEGRNLLNDEFTFVLTEVANSNGDALANALSWQVKNNINGKVVFPEITKDAAGTYYYLLSEQIGSTANGIQYDQTKYLVTVAVEDTNLNGVLDKSVTYTVLGETAAAEPVFTNKYVPSAVSTGITGDKTITGTVLQGGDFDFELYASDSNWTLGEKLETVKNDENGKIEFSALEFQNAGEYYYIVKEVNGGETIDGVTYDDAVYKIRIVVTDDLIGQLHSEIHVYDIDDIPQESVIFANSYTAPEDPDSPRTGIKDNLALWVAMMLLSAGGIITLLSVGKGKKEQEN